MRPGYKGQISGGDVRIARKDSAESGVRARPAGAVAFEVERDGSADFFVGRKDGFAFEQERNQPDVNVAGSRQTSWYGKNSDENSGSFRGYSGEWCVRTNATGLAYTKPTGNNGATCPSAAKHNCHGYSTTGAAR